MQLLVNRQTMNVRTLRSAFDSCIHIGTCTCEYTQYFVLEVLAKIWNQCSPTN